MKTGRVFSLAEENEPIAGCTMSMKLAETEGAYTLLFSLSEGTDISATAYEQPHFFYVLSGTLTLIQQERVTLRAGDGFLSDNRFPVAVEAPTDVVYVEIGLKEDMNMNKIIAKDGVFQLKDLLPYKEGRVINEGLIASEGTRFAILSLAAGTSLPKHAAPSDALLFALDGQAVFTHNGKEFAFRAGDNFAMHKGDVHSVKAVTDFKFALLLTKPDEKDFEPLPEFKK